MPNKKILFIEDPPTPSLRLVQSRASTALRSGFGGRDKE